MKALRFAAAVMLLASAPLMAADVKVLRQVWHDAKRNRNVPVKLYFPADLTDARPAPIVLFSHGLGGSRETGEVWGNAFAAAGYVSVHMQHAGSDESLWRGQLGDLATLKERVREGMSAAAYMDRIGDVRFVLDELARLNAAKSEHPLKGKLDLERIAMTGHSFGAQTTQAMAGQLAQIGRREGSVHDERIRCAIALSPAPPAGTPAMTAVAFSKIRMPVLWMTGTKDSSKVREVAPEQRRVPFDKTKATDQYLVIFNDADHMALCLRGPMGTKLENELKGAAMAFLDAYLRGNAEKQKTLADDLRTIVRDTATVESK